MFHAIFGTYLHYNTIYCFSEKSHVTGLPAFSLANLAGACPAAGDWKGLNLGGVEGGDCSHPRHFELMSEQRHGLFCFSLHRKRAFHVTQKKTERWIAALPCSTDVDPEHAWILKGILTLRQVALSSFSAPRLLMVGAHHPVACLKYTRDGMGCGHLPLQRSLFRWAIWMLQVQRPISQVA